MSFPLFQLNLDINSNIYETMGFKWHIFYCNINQTCSGTSLAIQSLLLQVQARAATQPMGLPWGLLWPLLVAEWDRRLWKRVRCDGGAQPLADTVSFSLSPAEPSDMEQGVRR